MARPNKTQAIAIRNRDKLIFNQDKRGYPLDYLASFHNLTKGRIIQILKNESDEKKKVEEGNKQNNPTQRKTK